MRKRKTLGNPRDTAILADEAKTRGKRQAKTINPSTEKEVAFLNDPKLEAKPSRYWQRIGILAESPHSLCHGILLVIDSYLRNEDRSHLMYLAISKCVERGTIRNKLDRLLLFPVNRQYGRSPSAKAFFHVPLVYRHVIRDRHMYFQMYGSMRRFGPLARFVTMYCDFLQEHDVEFQVKDKYHVVLPVTTEPASKYTINIMFSMADVKWDSYPNDVLVSLRSHHWQVRFPVEHHDQVGVLEPVVYTRPIRRSEVGLLTD